MPQHFNRQRSSFLVVLLIFLEGLQWRKVIIQICWQGSDTKLTNHIISNQPVFLFLLLLCLYKVWKGKQDHHKGVRTTLPGQQEPLMKWFQVSRLHHCIVGKYLHILKYQGKLQSITRGENCIARATRTFDEMFSYLIGVVNNVPGIPVHGKILGWKLWQNVYLSNRGRQQCTGNDKIRLEFQTKCFLVKRPEGSSTTYQESQLQQVW